MPQPYELSFKIPLSYIWLFFKIICLSNHFSPIFRLSFHVKKAQVLYICCSKTLCAMCSVLKFQSYVFVVLNHSDNMSSDSYSNLWFLSNLMIINIYFLLHIWFSCKLLIYKIANGKIALNKNDFFFTIVMFHFKYWIVILLYQRNFSLDRILQ